MVVRIQATTGGWALVLLSLAALPVPSAGLRTPPEAKAKKVLDSKPHFTGTPPPKGEKRKERHVVKFGTPEDPFETAMHYDDYVSGFSHKLLNLSRPVCVTDVKSKRNNCKLLSQRLCSRESVHLSAVGGGHGQCLKARRTCAVVGSSEHLLSQKWGGFIDSQDLVIRINQAPSGTRKNASDARYKFADHVGTRTDVRFVNSVGAAAADEEPMCLFLHNPYIPDSCGRYCWRNPSLCNLTHKDEALGVWKTMLNNGRCRMDDVRCRSSGRTKEKDEDWGRNFVFLDNIYAGVADQVVPHSTAGFKAVIYALSTCEKVRVLGFGPSCSGETGARYYKNQVLADPWHHYEEELMLMRRADRLGTKAIIPPEARGWIRAKSVEVMLPPCVKMSAQLSITDMLRPFKDSLAVNLVSLDAPSFA